MNNFDKMAQDLSRRLEEKTKGTLAVKYEKLASDLLDSINKGDLNENTISNFSYGHLNALMHECSKLKNGQKIFLIFKSYLESINISRLKKQEKIKIAFVVNYSSTWIGDELYRLLEASDRFEPYILLLSNHNGQTDDMRLSEYYNNLKFFSKKGVNLIETIDEDGVQKHWADMDVKPQVYIWLSSWMELFKGDFFLLNYSLETLHAYIPYSYMLADNVRNKFVYNQYNHIIHNLAWRNFELSKLDLYMAGKYAFVGNENNVYTGYPRMDAFYKKKGSESELWNRLLLKSGNSSAKKIIWSPHHTVFDEGSIYFSTFATNYKFMLELAEKYQDETVWIFKPHPLIKYKSVQMGIFIDENEWNEYEAKWRSLKNADVVWDGDYAELFLESDGMINDSVSFLVEYLFTGKPLLFLRREEQVFNEANKMLSDVHYSVAGDDFEGIERFLKEVILEENDIRKDVRMRYFREHYDYKSEVGGYAVENIYRQLCLL